jgi:hypothetical protein
MGTGIAYMEIEWLKFNERGYVGASALLATIIFGINQVKRQKYHSAWGQRLVLLMKNVEQYCSRCHDEPL